MVYSARSKSVHTVVVDGRVVLEDRRPTLIDQAAVFGAVESSVARVFDRMGYRVEPRWRPIEPEEGA
jgi:hypothetical protein